MRGLLVIAIFLLHIGAAFAQSVSDYGAISGSITDGSGASVGGAAVTVSNARFGIRRVLQSSDSGLFSAASLPPAKGYEVEIRKNGFSSYRMQDLEIQVGQIAEVRASLILSTVSETVEVTADQIAIDLAKTGVSDVVNSNQILNLPINGRRVDSFVLLSPAVANEGSFGDRKSVV